MRVLVHAFQSLGRVSLDVAGLTVLVGPSNRGKSALIRAIQGALFNLGGSYFVRKGSSATQVTLEDVPSVGSPLAMVEWRKGKATNAYTINGEEYKRIGKGAPPALTDAGFRDVWIGDKDHKNGEYIRPQVHGQFDSVFLLGRSPGFIADVLSTIQRRAVITRAQDQCAADLRNEKRLVDVRAGDLTASTQAAMVFAPVAALVERSSALSMACLQAATEHARLEGIAALVTRCATLRAAVAALRLRVQALADIELACARVLSLAAREQALATAYGRYTQLRPFVGVTLPPAVDRALMTGLDLAVERASTIARASMHYWRVKPLTVMPLPPATVAPLLRSLDHWASRAAVLESRVVGLQAAVAMVYEHQRVVRAVAEEHDNLLAQYDTLRTEAKVCPLCEKPFDAVQSPAATSA